MMKLDDSDRAILRELQTDGRMPVANLAKVVGLSQTATRHRLQKMLQSEAIQVVAVGDARLLGLDVEAMLGVSLDGDPRIAAETFGKIPEVMNVMVCAGRFELLVEVICKNNYELDQLLTHQLRPIEGVRRIEIFLYLECTKDSYNWCHP
jgi:Lrp/AsnC family transcriptional regulator for asnA, asnC and gidA